MSDFTKERALNRVFFESIVGSHIWQMARPDSDIDKFLIFAEPTSRVLDGRANTGKTWDTGSPDDTPDLKIHEAGKVVDQLLSGNINYVRGVLSPKVEKTDFNGEMLRRITRDTISAQTFYSIRGLAKSNYKKYYEKGLDPTDRRAQKATRLLEFGIRLLRNNNIEFKPPEHTSFEDVPGLIEELEEARENTVLPETVDEKPFRVWLRGVRFTHM